MSLKPKDYCNEFTVGVCTKTLFFVEDVTLPCTKMHSEQKHHEYKERKTFKEALEIEYEVFKIYNTITNDIERKVANNQRRLLNKLDSKEIQEKLDYLENTFHLNQNKDVTDLNIILKAHGKLIMELKNYTPINKYRVCSTCSVFLLKESGCSHKFHNAYKLIRTKRDELREKLYKN